MQSLQFYTTREKWTDTLKLQTIHIDACFDEDWQELTSAGRLDETFHKVPITALMRLFDLFILNMDGIMCD